MINSSLLQDERIPVRFGTLAEVEPHDALLIEGAAAADRAAVARFVVPVQTMGHPIGCACCVPRGPVAAALGKLFLARARGELPWFRSVLVVASAAGVDAVRAALAGDVVTAARFREECGGTDKGAAG